MEDERIVTFLYSNDFASIVSFIDRYPFYIGRKVFPIIKEHRSKLSQQLIQEIFRYIQTFYPHERLFSEKHESFTKKTAILNIHNRYY